MEVIMGYDEGWERGMFAISQMAAAAAIVAEAEATSHRQMGGPELLIVAAESRRVVWGHVRDVATEAARRPGSGCTEAAGESLDAQTKGWVEALFAIRGMATAAEGAAAAEAAEHRRSTAPVELLLVAAESRRCIWAYVRSFTGDGAAHPPASVMHA
jgi:hypothetical protein